MIDLADDERAELKAMTYLLDDVGTDAGGKTGTDVRFDGQEHAGNHQ